MMISIIAFAVLAAYFVIMAWKFGLPEMVSDTFYQLEDWRKNTGVVFSMVMMCSALAMLPVMLEAGGAQPLAFLGCVGLMIVGAAPNYCDKDTYPVHKGGAMVAAIGCVGWAMSVNWWPTVLVASMYAAYVAVAEAYKILDNVWYMSRGKTYFHRLYWAEVAGFVDVWLTLWTK